MAAVSLTLLLGAVAAAWHWAPGWAEEKSVGALRAARFDPARLRVESIGPWGARVSDVALGRKAFTFEAGRVEAAYTPRGLLTGEIDTLTAAGVRVALDLEPGLRLRTGDRTRPVRRPFEGKIPVRKVVLEDAAFDLSLGGLRRSWTSAAVFQRGASGGFQLTASIGGGAESAAETARVEASFDQRFRNGSFVFDLEVADPAAWAGMWVEATGRPLPDGAKLLSGRLEMEGAGRLDDGRLGSFGWTGSVRDVVWEVAAPANDEPGDEGARVGRPGRVRPGRFALDALAAAFRYAPGSGGGLRGKVAGEVGASRWGEVAAAPFTFDSSLGEGGAWTGRLGPLAFVSGDSASGRVVVDHFRAAPGAEGGAWEVAVENRIEALKWGDHRFSPAEVVVRGGATGGRIAVSRVASDQVPGWRLSEVEVEVGRVGGGVDPGQGSGPGDGEDAEGETASVFRASALLESLLRRRGQPVGAAFDLTVDGSNPEEDFRGRLTSRGGGLAFAGEGWTWESLGGAEIVFDGGVRGQPGINAEAVVNLREVGGSAGELSWSGGELNARLATPPASFPYLLLGMLDTFFRFGSLGEVAAWAPQFQVELELAGARVEWGESLSAEDVSLVVPALRPMAAGKPWAGVQVAAGRVVWGAEHLGDLTAQVDVFDQRIEVAGRASLGDGAWPLRFTQRFDLSGRPAARGTVEISTGVLEAFRPPARWGAALASARVSGTVSAQAETNYAGGRWDASGVLHLDGLGLTFPGAGSAVEEIDLALQMESLAAARSAGEQRLRLGRLEAGEVVLTGGEVAFELPGDGRLVVSRARAGFAGGEVAVERFSYDLETGSATFDLHFNRLELARLQELLPDYGYTIEGRVEGTVPVMVEQGRPSVGPGRLSLVPGETGRLRYGGRGWLTRRYEAGTRAYDSMVLVEEALGDLLVDTFVLEIAPPDRPDSPVYITVGGRPTHRYVKAPILIDIPVDIRLSEVIDLGLVGARWFQLEPPAGEGRKQ